MRREVYRQRRKSGLCVDCNTPSGKYARCESCRKRVYVAEVRYRAELNNAKMTDHRRRIERMLSLSAHLDHLRKRLEVA